jgi:hypothetical protein
MTFKFSTNLSGAGVIKIRSRQIPLVFKIIKDYLSFRQDLETNRLLSGVTTKRRYTIVHYFIELRKYLLICPH